MRNTYGYNMGPQLPFKLLKEVQGDGGDARAGRRPVNRKQARKAQRVAKKQQHLRYQQKRSQGAAGKRRHEHEPPHQPPHPPDDDSRSAKRPRTADGPARRDGTPNTPAPQPPAAQPPPPRPAVPKRTAIDRPGPQPPTQPARRVRAGGTGGSQTRFAELLPSVGANSRAGFEADLALERKMDKQLKLKKGSTSTGPMDGLDDLLDGITAGSSLLPAYMQGGAGSAGASDDDAFSSGGGSGGGSSEEGSGSESSGLLDEDEGSPLSGSDHGSDPGSYMESGSGLSGDEEAESGDADADDGDAVELGGREADSQDGSDEGSDSGRSGADSDGGGRDPGAAHGGSAGRSSGDEDGDVLTGSGAGSDSDGDSDGGGDGGCGPGAAGPAGGAGGGGAGRYVPPALRAAVQGGEDSALRRRMTGLINRLSEANMQGIVREVASLYTQHGRRLVAEALAEELLSAAADGPRASELFAAVSATFVAALAASVRAQDVGARFVELLARRLEQAYQRGDSLAQHNLVLLLAYCYSTGLLEASCCYSLLAELTRRFSEADVAMMVVLLRAVGLQLRSDDPSAMKDFVISVHAAAATARRDACLTKRAELLLEAVTDVKNNRRPAGGGGGGSARKHGGAAAVLQPGALKWLRQSGVADVALRNLSWAKLLQPDKKGMWWLPSATDAANGLLPGLGPEALGPLGGPGSGGGGGGDAGALLQLAAAQRMTTDVRRAVFVAIMGSEDCTEACEKLLRLPLKGEQDREVVRVLVDCCLQERVYNPYYAHLAARLAAASKNHKMTLQFCLWDQFKEAGGAAAADVRRITNLARFTAALVAGFTLPLALLKPVDFAAATTWAGHQVFLWRLFFLHLLSSRASDADTTSIFTRLASQQQSGQLSRSLALFLRSHVSPWLAAGGAAHAALAKATVAADAVALRLTEAERVLASSTAALLAA